MKTPSNVQVGEKVNLNFFVIPKIEECEIYGINFTEGKVRYDILVPIVKNEKIVSDYTLIENVDSICIEKLI